jgi:hypothetical protein
MRNFIETIKILAGSTLALFAFYLIYVGLWIIHNR